jgi:hypothetical protein
MTTKTWSKINNAEFGRFVGISAQVLDKIDELGGTHDLISVEEYDSSRTVIREWPTLESANLWCEWLLKTFPNAEVKILSE